MEFRVKIDDKTDRENLALILIKNGYIVRIKKHKPVNSKLEYWVEWGKADAATV